ncbi:MAG: choice-of-anchor U domain-containing protein [Candidatus Saccharimonas sp.]
MKNKAGIAMRRSRQWITKVGLLVISLLLVTSVAVPNAMAADGYSWTDVATNNPSTASKEWRAAASDSTGKFLAAAYNNGDIFTSNDYGATWKDVSTTTDTATANKQWYYMASNASGQRLVAVARSGDIWTSSNYGDTWTNVGTTTDAATHNKDWIAVTSDSSGQYLAVGMNGGGLWTSNDYGQTWTDRSVANSSLAQSWRTMASSASGKYLVAGVNNGDIWTSNDYGVDWVNVSSSDATMTLQRWYGVTSDTSGKYLAAVVPDHDIWASSNYGANWTNISLADTATHGKNWQSITSDSTGQHLAAVAYGNGLWISNDYGTSWTNVDTDDALMHSQSFYYIASSASGDHLITTAQTGDIWVTSNPALTPVSDNENNTPTPPPIPNAGDVNNDGTVDSGQTNVSSFVNSVTNQYTSVSVSDSSCTLSDVSAASVASEADAGYSYPMGLVGLTATCGTPGFTTTINQYFYNPPAGNFVLRKLVNGKYVDISNATISRTTIGGQPVLKVSYQVTDGGALDDDGIANGVIVDPAGPALKPVGAPNTGYIAQSKPNMAIVISVAATMLALIGAIHLQKKTR